MADNNLEVKITADTSDIHTKLDAVVARMKSINPSSLSKIFEKFQGMPHEIIGLLIFLVCLTFHWISGRDLGSNMTIVVGSTYGFLLGHGIAEAKWGDNDANGGSK